MGGIDVSSQTVLLLRGMARGEREAADRLMEHLYTTLVTLADARLQGDPLARSIDPASLVGEVYLKLVGGEPVEWNDRVHFLAVASNMMRRTLLDIANAAKADKRGGSWSRITLSGIAARQDETRIVDVEAMERALARLTELDERQARVVELRFFAGMTEEEVAAAMGMSRRAVQIDWAHAKAWLKRELVRSPDGSAA